MEWNGQVWEKTDLVKDVLRKMGQRVAQRTEMMRVIFHADATLDVFVREVGEENFVQIATLQYDISSMIPNRMNWIFTQEQSRYVETELIGEPLPCSIFSPISLMTEETSCLCILQGGITPAHCI